MDLGNLALSDFLERLKCDNCQSYLSYFPIFLSPRMKNFCGRCYMTPRRGERLRNEVYETICQFLKFPCRYKNNGCSEELLPKDMPEHEETCQYKPMKCPSKCPWEGPFTELLQHYRKKHNDLMLVNDKEFEMDLTNFHQQENFLEYKGILFTSSRKFDSWTNMLEWAIFQTGNKTIVESLACTIKVTNKKRKISIEINTTNSCKIDFASISLECLKEASEAFSVVLGKLSMEKQKNEEANFSTVANNEINSKMLSAIKCFMCSNYVTPPIFECLKEEAALCIWCQNKHVGKCELCEERSAINKVNICLDKMAKCLNYPCRYQSHGCTFVAKHDEITKHHEICPHKKYLCPVREFVKCKWRGLLPEVTVHLEHAHEHEFPICLGDIMIRLLDKEDSKSTDLTDNHLECDLIDIEGRLFRLTYYYARNKSAYYFELQMIDNFDKPVRYEIEFINKYEGKRMLMRKLCPPLTKIELLFSNNDQYCFFTLDQVASLAFDFINNEMISFMVNIFEI